jgi:hypothetical protein
MIEINIPKEKTFDVPEGFFKAQVSGVRSIIKQTSRGAQDWVRVLFDAQVPGLSDRLDAMAGRSFKLDVNPGSDLRNFLVGLLGQQFFTARSGQKVDLESLVGRECEIQLEHYWGKDFEKPLVVVARVAPPGTLKLTQNISEGGKD